jgi:hypothetical protein
MMMVVADANARRSIRACQLIRRAVQPHAPDDAEADDEQSGDASGACRFWSSAKPNQMLASPQHHRHRDVTEAAER